MRLFVLVCVAASTLVKAEVPFPSLSDAERKRLEAQEVVVRELKPTDGKGVAAESLGLIDAPTAEVWPVLRDCQHFKHFMPKTKNSELLEEGGEKLCKMELRLPFPLTDLWSVSRNVLVEEGDRFSRAWSLVRGTYHRNSGSWRLLPWADGKKTLVVYTIDSDPKMLVPDAMIRAAQTGSLPDVFVGIRARVASLRR